MGATPAPLPTRIRSSELSPRPPGPAPWAQTATADTSASAMTPRAAPSRRCAGSSSRAVAALRPTARAMPPIMAAIARQIAEIARQIVTKKPVRGSGGRRSSLAPAGRTSALTRRRAGSGCRCAGHRSKVTVRSTFRPQATRLCRRAQRRPGRCAGARSRARWRRRAGYAPGRPAVRATPTRP